MIKIYNTLTKRKEEFKPIEPHKVRMYVCGPTVYNLIHIGNARPYIVFDTVRRYFESVGYEVNYVQNFTDVDDKIIKKANEEGRSTNEVVTQYIEETLKDVNNLNVTPATHHPRVTEEMDRIIEMIKELIEKGYAYEINGTVYFDTAAFEQYGKLSKKVLEELEAGRSERVALTEEKKNHMDFVLWKPKKEGEPYWESPWSNGRPGWHIECSAMAKRYLGDTIDIHAGGEDLVFPHHENEIAQSECANGKEFAHYWMHNAFLNIDNKKMSKSLGNFKTLRDVGEMYGYDVVRFFMLNAHYRSPLNFSAELIESAKNSLERIKNAKATLSFALEHSQIADLTEEEKALLKELDDFKARFHEHMEDDFNTADAISIIFELVKFANTYAKEGASQPFVEAVLKLFNELTDILGLIYDRKGNNEDGLSDEEIKEYIEKRTAAKKARDFAEADRIRDFLKDQGVLIEDTREGVRFKRI
ncbi:cysteinyl-tRNA synthetase [Cellulosilyticum lentocellum DSM 5427]|uniref:Cysteine--tRNA ligase n=1 Tax=Cellulosilyticum lentocellum (strain ATCC 49066 / DSM 5427 / NCIMB 11756 / RHM5) TaxID=642492 RepID=F2JI46_CELLD|nr:cysteine--tRNA ligase [Cellulosilyticum lentocellum]ADZ83074.1 cysteinyl-tRNA synthetase [Cellulosilyticum lentocellum DSM 5427]